MVGRTWEVNALWERGGKEKGPYYILRYVDHPGDILLLDAEKGIAVSESLLTGHLLWLSNLRTEGRAQAAYSKKNLLPADVISIKTRRDKIPIMRS